MCYKTNLYGIMLCVLGIGLLLSCVLAGICLRLVLGFVITAVGLLIIHHR